MQVHSTRKHVEYRGEIVELTNSLLQLPAGGQVLLSDTTFQRIGGRLHEVKLPTLQGQRPPEGLRSNVEGQSRKDLNGQSRKDLDGQSRNGLGGQSRLKPGGASTQSLDGQPTGTSRQSFEGGGNSRQSFDGSGSNRQSFEAGSASHSRRNSSDSTSKLVVRMHANAWRPVSAFCTWSVSNFDTGLTVCTYYTVCTWDSGTVVMYIEKMLRAATYQFVALCLTWRCDSLRRQSSRVFLCMCYMIMTVRAAIELTHFMGLQGVSAPAKSGDKLPVNPVLSPLARGAPPTIEEKLRMAAVARTRRPSFDRPPARVPQKRFSLKPQDYDISNGTTAASAS